MHFRHNIYLNVLSCGITREVCKAIRLRHKEHVAESEAKVCGP